MKKGLIFILIFAILVAAVSAADCRYDPRYDFDNDKVMSDDADCGDDYEYDCDDNDKDSSEDCENSLWKRFVSWFKGENRKPSRFISGSSVKKLANPISTIKEKVSREKETTETQTDCAVTICLNANLKEIYCPLDYDDCCAAYSGCRVIECDSEEEFCEETEEAEESTDICDKGYHDCVDDGEEIICKGSFKACKDAFDECACGTEDEVEGDQLAPEIDTSQEIDCDTGVFICSKQSISMSGDIAESVVTCKGTFQQCSIQHGECSCGNSTKTDFPTKYIGDTGEGGETVDEAFWCEYKDKKIPCYMLPENCNKKKNTCDKGNGVMITCDGTFEFCNKRYAGTCLCGVEMMGYGLMNTEAE
ncbi:hypothetical protein KY349_00800 [Candidatus Woesearchaeota archaeon]|nr:hypothetical protein [Candidatus Woesearchaeota archaeon]